MKPLKSALLLLLALALLVMIPVALRSQQPSKKTAAKKDGGPVHSIELPDNAPEIPRGPNVEAFEKNCLLCHSARYVLMQPRFPEKVWTAEVKKMVANYGAPISETDQPLVVGYLTATHGVK